MVLTKKEVEHIADLARIKLSDKEKEKMAEDMAAILGYIDKLNEVKTDGVEPAAQVSGLENVFRKDEPGKEPADRQAIIGQFPDRKDDHLKVKQVFSAQGGPASGGEDS